MQSRQCPGELYVIDKNFFHIAFPLKKKFTLPLVWTTAHVLTPTQCPGSLPWCCTRLRVSARRNIHQGLRLEGPDKHARARSFRRQPRRPRWSRRSSPALWVQTARQRPRSATRAAAPGSTSQPWQVASKSPRSRAVRGKFPGASARHERTIADPHYRPETPVSRRERPPSIENTDGGQH